MTGSFSAPFPNLAGPVAGTWITVPKSSEEGQEPSQHRKAFEQLSAGLEGVLNGKQQQSEQTLEEVLLGMAAA